MTRIWWLAALLALALGVAVWGCGGDDDDNDDGADGDDDDGTGQDFPWAAVDVLLVVDNSGSMNEEQQIFATSVFKLVNSLVAPLPGSLWPAADDVRVAVVSTDMGLSWGGNAYQDGDGWPGSLPAGCSATGDNGEFQTYAGSKSVDLQSGVIPCDESNAQCPPGWDCEQIGDDGIGLCLEPNNNGNDQACPVLEEAFAHTNATDPNGLLAMQVACLSSLGTSGCGFEQQLQSAAVAVTREDQTAFLREDALLAVVMVTDEEDCSIEHSELFLVDEIQNQADKKVNIACNLDANEQYLFSTTSFYQRLVDSKQGRVSGVVFGAIVGVPMVEACQGLGSEIVACLNHADMQKVPIQEETAQGDTWFFKPACNRMQGSVEVTKARPGRRFVSLAQSFQSGGYIYSICNEDWTPAMSDLAAIIAERLQD